MQRKRSNALYRELGMTDAITTCDCCGRTELKATVELHHSPSGEVVYFGPQCAEAALHPWAHFSSKYSSFIPGESSHDE